MSAISDLLADLDIEDWLSAQGIDYKRTGNQLKLAECPFCGDTSGRVYMRADDGRGTCFRGACGARFNLFSFAKQYLHVDARGVIRHFEDYARGIGALAAKRPSTLATIATTGWELPESTPLPTSEGHTHPELIKRHILLTTQSAFGLRFCEQGHYAWQQDGTTRSMSFSQRIIIPVHDLDGSLQTFQGRDVTGLADKRYLFPSGLPGTGRFLYGGQLVRGHKHLVMGEGPFDVMAIHQAVDHPDFRGLAAIGSFGLSIGAGDDQANDQLARFRQLHREGLETVTIMWDGEHAAYSAALDAGTLLRRQGLKVRIATLPIARDPNEVPSEVVRQAIADARELTPINAILMRCGNPYPKVVG